MGKLLHKLVHGLLPASWFIKVKASPDSRKSLPFLRGPKSKPPSSPTDTELSALLEGKHSHEHEANGHKDLLALFEGKHSHEQEANDHKDLLALLEGKHGHEHEANGQKDLTNGHGNQETLTFNKGGGASQAAAKDDDLDKSAVNQRKGDRNPNLCRKATKRKRGSGVQEAAGEDEAGGDGEEGEADGVGGSSREEDGSGVGDGDGDSSGCGRGGGLWPLGKRRRRMRWEEYELPECLCEVVGSSTALVKFSEDPDREFWESMVDMIVANGLWEVGRLEFLLYCYLTLNEPHLHPLIGSTFLQVLKDIERAS